MEIATIKKSLKKFGLNFNSKIVKAIEDLHKDSSETKVIRCEFSTLNDNDVNLHLTDELISNLKAGDRIIASAQFSDVNNGATIEMEFRVDYVLTTSLDSFEMKRINTSSISADGIMIVVFTNNEGSFEQRTELINP